jgi:hypothetical protein
LRRLSVKKIALVRGKSEDVAMLEACLRLLFPECEVENAGSLSMVPRENLVVPEPFEGIEGKRRNSLYLESV